MEGVSAQKRTKALFRNPGTTSARPASAASSAAAATVEAGSTAPSVRTPGRVKIEDVSNPPTEAKPVSVAPGRRQVTATPAGLSSGRIPAEKTRTKAFVAA
eukprot:scaffold139852_cov35-Tisochrysis_lutea.AAC.2